MYQNAIFLSDGNGGDPLSAAENFHKNGIRLTSVAIGAANQDLMRELTGMNRSPPLTYKNHYFEHNDANKLAEAAKDMKKQILSCQGNEVSTKSGGYNIQTTTSVAPSTTTKDECKQVESKGLEIALIVDTSGRYEKLLPIFCHLQIMLFLLLYSKAQMNSVLSTCGVCLKLLLILVNKLRLGEFEIKL